MLAFIQSGFERCNISPVFRRALIIVWHLGVCLGLLAGVGVEPAFLNAVRLSINGHASMVWLFVSTLFLYVLFFCMRHVCGRVLLISAWGMKAFSYSFSMVTVVHSFNDAGWLACILWLWCDALLMVLLARFYWNCPNWHSKLRMLNFVASAAASLLFIMINCFVVGPFRIGLHI